MRESGQQNLFVARLERLMAELNLSRVALARELGLDKSVIGRWLGGINQPTGHNLTRLTEIARRRWPEATTAIWSEPASAAPGSAPSLPAPAPQASDRLVLQGLRVPRNPALEATYVGFWSGFVQSLRNRNTIAVVSFNLGIDGLGLRCEFTEGRFWGEGPAFAISQRLQCFWEMAPAYDRVCSMLFNGGFSRDSLSMDGLVLSPASDSPGTPAASPMLLFRIGDEGDYRRLGGLEGMRDRLAEVNLARPGGQDNAAASLLDLAPDGLAALLRPLVGVSRTDGDMDYVLRMPFARFQSALASEGPAPEATARQVRANLRGLFGLN